MRKYLLTLVCFSVILTTAKAQDTRLNPREFANKIKAVPDALVLDVRTPAEYQKDHLGNSVNINWRDSTFTARVSRLDKSKPLLVYCLSGIRSKEAAEKLRAMGFSEVYEMEGGLVRWKAEGLSAPKPEGWTGMSEAAFSELLKNPKPVLVDFFAEWCGPCKKMEPYVTELKKTRADQITIIQLDADQHSSLLSALKIEALPVFRLYQNGQMKWQHEGYISREDLVRKLGFSE